MTDRSHILHFLKEHKKELEERFGVTKIGLFGSYARGEQHENSDIDLAVELHSENKFRSFFALKAYLEQVLHTSIDLGIESTLKPVIKESVKKEIIYV